MFSHRLCSCLGAALLFLAATASESGSAAFGDGPLTLVVPFPAGGRADIAARNVADGLSKSLGSRVIVVNRTGAGGVVAARYVAESAPDGRTMLITSAAILSAQYTLASSNKLSDFKVVGLVENTPPVLAVPYDAPWRTLRELIAAAGREAGSLTIGSVTGASAQIVAAGFLEAAGIQMLTVPFKGDADAIAALAGGHIHANTSGFSGLMPLVEAKKVRVLAVAASERQTMLPHVPTFREQGVEFESGLFLAIFVPKVVSEEIVTKLEEALRSTMHSEQVVEKMKSAGLGPTFLGRVESEKFLQREDETYLRLIKKLGLLRRSD
jgi:tripartite-type tricarboxylate transporter receptor subunit TctC